jgi:NADH:ubiquinone oxidoreductase subunit C
MVLDGLRELAQEPGDYCLTVKPDGTWIPHPLTLDFKVRCGICTGWWLEQSAHLLSVCQSVCVSVCLSVCDDTWIPHPLTRDFKVCVWEWGEQAAQLKL